MLKVGIAGLRGLSTLVGFDALEDVEVTAFCDLDEDLLREKQKEHGIKNGYRIFEDMLESDIDAVVIATPMQCHVPQAIAALEAGKHVMSEVTAGVTMDELWWLIESVERSGKVYMMAENYCYMPDNQLILNLVKSNLLGEIYYGEGEYIHTNDGIATYDYSHRSASSIWRRHWQLGKRGTFYPTHSIGPVMQWFGDDRIKSISTFGSGRHNNLNFRQDDTSITMCQLESGKLARIRLDVMSRRPHHMHYYTIQGTKGVVEASRFAGLESKIWLEGMNENGEDPAWRNLSEFHDYLPDRYKNATEEQKNTGHNGGDFFIVEDFVNAIRKGSKPAIDVYQACEWTAVGLLSELSITNNSRTMEMPHFRKNMPYEEQIIKL